MDGQWPQQNSGVHTDLDLNIGSPSEYNYTQIFQALGDNMDEMLALGPDTNIGNTGGTGAAAADQGNNGGEMPAARRFNRKRHNKEQIDELEAAFQQTPHPDENQRRELGRRVGIGEAQVKFWFQNRRSAKKTQDERQAFRQLQQVNEALQAEHRALVAATQQNCCLNCVDDGNGTRQQLLAENARLKEELQRVNAIVKRLTGGREVAPPIASHFPATNPNNVRRHSRALAAADHAPPPPSHRAIANPVMMPANEGLVRRQRDTETMLVDIAGRALTEFCTVVSAGTSMWLQTPDDEVLNIHKYTEAMFPSIFGPYWMGSIVDGTRRTGEVMCTADNVVGILMDAARWSEMFPSIVASATASRIGTPTSQHGIILMDAELRVLSPRVPVRKLKFVRNCQQLEACKWAVVDVSVDGILGHDDGVPSTCRLLPSGCLIEVQNKNYCKVTWIVNMEYDQTSVSAVYHPLIRSGQALGACRWLGSLQRQCEYFVILHSPRIPAALGDTTDISPDGKKNLFRVVQRMTRSFYEAMSGRGAQPWISVDRWRGGCGIGAERFEVDAQVVTYSAVSGAPGSVVLSATATVWLPGVPAQQVFNYLCTEGRRGEWDILANGAPVIQQGKFTTGPLPGNSVSVLRSIESNGTDGDLILQEARTDPSCMVLAYAALDNESMHRAMGNGGLAALSLLPSGLVILPDGLIGPVTPPTSAASSSSAAAVGHKSNSGSFVSTMYQTLLNGQPPVKPSLEAIDNAGNQLCRVIRKIKDAVNANRVLDA